MSSVKAYWNNILAASGTTAEHALTCSHVILSLTLLHAHAIASYSACLIADLGVMFDIHKQTPSLRA